jgi:hypothetical protein
LLVADVVRGGRVSLESDSWSAYSVPMKNLIWQGKKEILAQQHCRLG